MKDKLMTVNEVASLCGVTVRTLHWYDEIGLLTPHAHTDANYRLYTHADLARLQEILFFREVGFPLKEITKLLCAPNYDRKEALSKHLTLLAAQRERIDGLMALVEEALSDPKKVSFDAFSTEHMRALRNQYRDEVIARWGDTDSFRAYEARTGGQSEQAQDEAEAGFFADTQDFFRRLAMLEGHSPQDEAVQRMVKQWQQYITDHFYPCTKPILSCLGQMYTDDARFSATINRCGHGDLAAFFSKAIEIYCSEA